MRQRRMVGDGDGFDLHAKRFSMAALQYRRSANRCSRRTVAAFGGTDRLPQLSVTAFVRTPRKRPADVDSDICKLLPVGVLNNQAPGMLLRPAPFPGRTRAAVLPEENWSRTMWALTGEPSTESIKQFILQFLQLFFFLP